MGRVDDPTEVEAARVAERAVAAAFNGVTSSARSQSPSPVGQEMPRLFGWDFSRVRIHDDGAAAAQARHLQARAFTTGHDIVSGRGELSRDTMSGRRALAHELTHVVQNAKAAGGQGRRSGGLADLISSAPAQLIRRIPMEGLPLRTDVANEKQRALDRERAGVDVGPGETWEELRKQGFGYVIDTARSVREGAVQGLRAIAASTLPTMLQTPVGYLIDLVAADLAIMTDLMLFNMSLALGVLESAVQTVVGLLTVILKLIEVAWHLIQALIYDLQERLAALGLVGEPDEELIRPFTDDVLQVQLMWSTLPEVVVALLVDWRDRFMAASHEERAVMAGDLAGDLLFAIVTWQASATRLGKVRMPALPALAAEPELAAALATGGSMRAGAGALTTTGTEVAVGGPVGATGATVLSASGRSGGASKPDPLQKSPEEVAEALRQELGEVDLTSLRARRDAALAKLADRGVDVEAARAQTEAVLSVVHNKEALTAAGRKLQELARSVTEAENAAEVARLASLGVQDNSGALAAYVAAAKKWATGKGRGIAEVYQSGDRHYVVRTTPAGESLPAELIVPRPGVTGVTHDAFMEQVIQQGEVIIDYALLGDQHGALPHLLQEMAFDVALENEGFAGGVVGYRKLLGELHAASKGPPPITFGTDSLDKASAGSELWLTTFDVLAGAGIAPEDLTPAFLRALGLDQGDL